MNGPPALEPESTVSEPTRRPRLADRYETGVALLAAIWTAAFIVRGRLAQADRLGEIGNEALLSLLFVVPTMLLAWGALAAADWWLDLGWFWSRDKR
jgi:hypothetical protein